MRVELVEADRSDEERLARLLELYGYDFSEIRGALPGEDGRFGYEHLAAYWTEPDRFPFLIRADGRLAGFALLSRGSRVTGEPGVMDMAEFFVARGVRRRRVGLSAAHEAFARFAGPWEVRALEANEGARLFWEQAVSAFAPGSSAAPWTDESGLRWILFRLTSPGRGAARGG